MKKKLKIITILTLIGIIFYSCYRDEGILKQNELSLSEQMNNAGLKGIVLGKKLENPYTVDNMRKAYKILKEKSKTLNKSYASKTLSDSLDIETTDYYVKFWIENDEQESLLIADSLNLSIIPLDVEIEQEGDSFVDNNTGTDKGQWLYTSVVKDYQFHPEIKYEIIADLFLIEESDSNEDDGDITTTIAGKSGISKNFLYDLEDEALKLTGNYTTRGTKNVNGLIAQRRKATPNGFVKVKNTVTGVMDPVVGVKVKTRRWFKWAKGWTNAQGYYKVNRGYRRNVNYTVVFKNTRGFKIWSSLISISSARYRLGKQSKSGYDINFATSSAGWRWATVNNATVKYLNYCTQFGIGLPPSNLRIVASRKDNGVGATPMLRRTLPFLTSAKIGTFLTAFTFGIPTSALWIVARFVIPDIIIAANSSQGTDGVFEITFHELAHASHFSKVGSSYWIKYINYIITYGKKSNPYGDGHGYNSGYAGVGEMWGYYIGARLSEEEFRTTNFYRFNPIDGWIPARINRRVVDEANFTIHDIYSSLNYNVTTIPKLKTEFNSRIGKNTLTVNQIFNTYGY